MATAKLLSRSRGSSSLLRSLTSLYSKTGKGLQAFSSSATGQEASGTASFGYQDVPESEKPKLVGEVFTKVAAKYDLMNDLMSGGLHRLWKDRLVHELRPFPGMHHLDVAGGTGDVAFRVLRAIQEAERRSGTFFPKHSTKSTAEAETDGGRGSTRVIVCDINADMLEVGKKRAQGLAAASSLEWLEGDAEALPLPSASIDAYTIAFGIRNVTHIDKALDEAYRVLRRGGRFLCLELSHVEDPLFRPIYDAYSFMVVPALGEMVAQDRQSYQYLVESIRRFPEQKKFASMIRDAGFEKVTYSNIMSGIVAIHSGFKL